MALIDEIVSQLTAALAAAQELAGFVPVINGLTTVTHNQTTIIAKGD